IIRGLLACLCWGGRSCRLRRRRCGRCRGGATACLFLAEPLARIGFRLAANLFVVLTARLFLALAGLGGLALAALLLLANRAATCLFLGTDAVFLLADARFDKSLGAGALLLVRQAAQHHAAARATLIAARGIAARRGRRGRGAIQRRRVLTDSRRRC